MSLDFLRHLFTLCSPCPLSLPPKNMEKPYGFLTFSWGIEKVHWE